MDDLLASMDDDFGFLVSSFAHAPAHHGEAHAHEDGTSFLGPSPSPLPVGRILALPLSPRLEGGVADDDAGGLSARLHVADDAPDNQNHVLSPPAPAPAPARLHENNDGGFNASPAREPSALPNAPLTSEPSEKKSSSLEHDAPQHELQEEEETHAQTLAEDPAPAEEPARADDGEKIASPSPSAKEPANPSPEEEEEEEEPARADDGENIASPSPSAKEPANPSPEEEEEEEEVPKTTTSADDADDEPLKWVCCDACGKWRKMFESVNTEGTWTCSMNHYDDKYNTCDAPQEPGFDEDDEEEEIEEEGEGEEEDQQEDEEEDNEELAYLRMIQEEDRKKAAKKAALAEKRKALLLTEDAEALGLNEEKAAPQRPKTTKELHAESQRLLREAAQRARMGTDAPSRDGARIPLTGLIAKLQARMREVQKAAPVLESVPKQPAIKAAVVTAEDTSLDGVIELDDDLDFNPNKEREQEVHAVAAAPATGDDTDDEILEEAEASSDEEEEEEEEEEEIEVDSYEEAEEEEEEEEEDEEEEEEEEENQKGAAVEMEAADDGEEDDEDEEEEEDGKAATKDANDVLRKASAAAAARQAAKAEGRARNAADFFDEEAELSDNDEDMDENARLAARRTDADEHYDAEDDDGADLKGLVAAGEEGEEDGAEEGRIDLHKRWEAERDNAAVREIERGVRFGFRRAGAAYASDDDEGDMAARRRRRRANDEEMDGDGMDGGIGAIAGFGRRGGAQRDDEDGNDSDEEEFNLRAARLAATGAPGDGDDAGVGEGQPTSKRRKISPTSSANPLAGLSMARTSSQDVFALMDRDMRLGSGEHSQPMLPRAASAGLPGLLPVTSSGGLFGASQGGFSFLGRGDDAAAEGQRMARGGNGAAAARAAGRSYVFGASRGGGGGGGGESNHGGGSGDHLGQSAPARGPTSFAGLIARPKGGTARGGVQQKAQLFTALESCHSKDKDPTLPDILPPMASGGRLIR
ncbi:CW-type domain-containing protein [Pseudoscourfieldia marina]